MFIGLLMLIIINSASAQGDALSIIRNCTTGCLDLTIQGGYPPYDVEWYHHRPNGYVLVNGWPKYGLAGDDGQEDLCIPLYEGSGIKAYYIIIHMERRILGSR